MTPATDVIAYLRDLPFPAEKESIHDTIDMIVDRLVQSGMDPDAGFELVSEHWIEPHTDNVFPWFEYLSRRLDLAFGAKHPAPVDAPVMPGAFKARRVHATELAQKGYRIFPIVPGTKVPPKDFAWKERATSDLTTIRDWWSGPYENHNVGIALNEDQVVLDFDSKNGKPGLCSLEELELLGLPPGFRTETPSGGRHVYLTLPQGVMLSNSVNKVKGFPGVDVRTIGGYVVGPGSTIDGTDYVDHGGVPELVPHWLIGILPKSGSKTQKVESRDPLIELDTDHAIQRATDYLRMEAPEAIEGSGGDHTTFKVAARAKDFGISKEKCFELMAEFWNDAKASPPWRLEDLETKVANAYAHGKSPPGVASGLAEFEPVEIEGQQAAATTGRAQGSAEDEPGDLWAGAQSGPPSLRMGHVPPLVEQFAIDRARRLGVETGAVAAMTLVALSSLVHASNIIQVMQRNPSWTQGPTLWGMLIGSSGSNKTATIHYATEPARVVNAAWCAEDARERATRADLHAVAKQTGAKTAAVELKTRGRRKIINDATTEAVAALLADNPGGLLLSIDELAGFFGGMDSYRAKGGRDRPFWLQAKEGQSFTVDRRSADPLFVKRNAVSIVGSIQPEKMQGLAPKLVDDGLLQRFWTIFIRGGDEPIDEPADEPLDARMKRMAFSMAGDERGRRYRFSPEAEAERRALEATKREELARAGHSGALSQCLEKLSNEFARLALVFHLIEWHAEPRDIDLIDDGAPELVSRETARRARLFLTEFVLGHAKVFYRQIVERGEATAHAQWIAGYILSRKIETITDRDIDRACPSLRLRQRRPNRLEAMHELEIEGWVKPQGRLGSDGGPSKWTVNPRVFDGRFAAIAEYERARRDQVRDHIADARTVSRSSDTR